MIGDGRLRHLLLVGAGHAHVEVLRAFARRPEPNTRLTLLTRGSRQPYSGMLPGVIAGAYTRAEAEIDIVSLAAQAGAGLLLDAACGLDPHGRTVTPAQGPQIGYDVVSLDIGARPSIADIPGAAEHAIPVKPIDAFHDRFAAMCARVLAGRSTRIAMVGAGAGGVELLLAVHHRLRHDAPAADLAFTLITGAGGLLPGFAASFRTRLAQALATRGIEVEAGPATSVAPDSVTLANGRRIAADEVLWTTQAAPADWLSQTGLACDERGFLRIDAALRAIGRSDVFAAGDMTAFSPPLPHSGVYAVRAGAVLAHNLRAALTGAPVSNWRPQRRSLVILSTADGSAVATRNGVTIAGRCVWAWKNRIDRRFIARFDQGTPAPTAPFDP